MTEDTKICPYCGNIIKLQAKKCKYCKKWLQNNNNSKQNSEKTKMIILFYILLFMIILISVLFSKSLLEANKTTNVRLTSFFENNSIDNLLEECTTNGEQITSRGGGEYTQFYLVNYYYCKNKPWPVIIKWKNSSSEKYYNYTVAYNDKVFFPFADSLGNDYDERDSDIIAKYNWISGEYKCMYNWKRADGRNATILSCKESDFIQELKKNSEWLLSKKDVHDDIFISECQQVETVSKFYLAPYQYVCKNKPWTTVHKDSKNTGKSYNYKIYYNGNFVDSVYYSWGFYHDRYNNKTNESILSEINNRIKELKRTGKKGLAGKHVFTPSEFAQIVGNK